MDEPRGSPREAVAALNALGDDVRVYYAYEVNADYEWEYGEPPGPEWLRRLLGIDYLSTATAVTIYRAQRQPACSLEAARRFALFDLSSCPDVTDAGIAHLAS